MVSKPDCRAIREYPFLDDWTDKADEWHEEGDVRPLFGTVQQFCQRPAGHKGEHEWPEMVAPKPTRQLGAEFPVPTGGPGGF